MIIFVLCSISRVFTGCPVDSRIAFKTLVLTFKAFEGISPKYLQDLITDFVPTRIFDLLQSVY